MVRSLQKKTRTGKPWLVKPLSAKKAVEPPLARSTPHGKTDRAEKEPRPPAFRSIPLLKKCQTALERFTRDTATPKCNRSRFQDLLLKGPEDKIMKETNLMGLMKQAKEMQAKMERRKLKSLTQRRPVAQAAELVTVDPGRKWHKQQHGKRLNLDHVLAGAESGR